MSRGSEPGRLLAPLCLLLVAGCGATTDGPDRQPSVTAAELGEQTVLAAEDYLAAAPYAGADPERGRKLYLQCRACHTLEAGGRTLAGPNLHGMFGRQVAADPAFPYSQALRQADFVWTPRALDAWITNPYVFLPGNRMSYGGMYKEEDRRQLIAWMLEAASE